MSKKTREIKRLFLSGYISCGGLGYFPKGSGTVASFFACGFWYFFRLFEATWIMAFLLVLLTVTGAMAVRAFEKKSGSHDSSVIVLDEWIGMGISMLLIPPMIGYIVLAFILFRIFDIWKPLGIRYFDQNYLKGWGVILDDVMAGLYALLILKCVEWGVNR